MINSPRLPSQSTLSSSLYSIIGSIIVIVRVLVMLVKDVHTGRYVMLPVGGIFMTVQWWPVPFYMSLMLKDTAASDLVGLHGQIKPLWVGSGRGWGGGVGGGSICRDPLGHDDHHCYDKTNVMTTPLL